MTTENNRTTVDQLFHRMPLEANVLFLLVTLQLNELALVAFHNFVYFQFTNHQEIS